MSQAPSPPDASGLSVLGIEVDWNVDPATLVARRSQHRWLRALYEEFGEELRQVTARAAQARTRMTVSGCTADLSDREAELLYVLVRALHPTVVVEMSPCHGYSTGYLLAALTANGHGELHSYEIVGAVEGTPIERVIRGNLPAGVDGDRLRLHVGDAREADIPSAQFAFIDSNHEAHFAAWYREELLTRVDVALVHDIVVKARRTLRPKGHALGVREQYHLLEALARTGRRVISVADAAPKLGALLSGLPVRHEVAGSDRAILLGRLSSDPDMAEATARTHDLQVRIEAGERPLSEVHDLAESSHGFLRQQALRLLPRMGYRRPAHPTVFPDWRLEECATLSAAVAAFEAALASADYRAARAALRRTRALGAAGRHLARELGALLP